MLRVVTSYTVAYGYQHYQTTHYTLSRPRNLRRPTLQKNSLLYLVAQSVTEFVIQKVSFTASLSTATLSHTSLPPPSRPVAAAILRNTLYKLSIVLRYKTPAADSDTRLIHAFLHHICLPPDTTLPLSNC